MHVVRRDFASWLHVAPCPALLHTPLVTPHIGNPLPLSRRSLAHALVPFRTPLAELARCSLRQWFDTSGTQ